MKNLCFLLLIFSFGCEKEPKIIASRHDNQEIDINNDSSKELKIDYVAYTWDGIGPNGTGEGITGSILPLDNISFLKADSGFFYNVGNSIMYSNNLSWKNTGFWAVKIETNLNRYTDPWKINAPELSKYYYVVFKKSDNSRNQFGWIKFTIDRYTGLITYIDSKIYENEPLIVGE